MVSTFLRMFDHFLETADTGNFKIPCKLNMTLLALAVLVQSHEVALDCWYTVGHQSIYEETMMIQCALGNHTHIFMQVENRLEQ